MWSGLALFKGQEIFAPEVIFFQTEYQYYFHKDPAVGRDDTESWLFDKSLRIGHI